MHIGFYERDSLIKQEVIDGLTSDTLLPIINDILNNYEIKEFIYTSGPGSHMSTKIAYMILKTLQITKDIPFRSVSAFELNSNKPIKALGKLYFIKEKETIITKKLEDNQLNSFSMPSSLSTITILEQTEPSYHIDAVN